MPRALLIVKDSDSCNSSGVHAAHWPPHAAPFILSHLFISVYLRSKIYVADVIAFTLLHLRSSIHTTGTGGGILCKMRPHLGKMRPTWAIWTNTGQKCSRIGGGGRNSVMKCSVSLFRLARCKFLRQFVNLEVETATLQRIQFAKCWFITIPDFYLGTNEWLGDWVNWCALLWSATSSFKIHWYSWPFSIRKICRPCQKLQTIKTFF